MAVLQTYCFVHEKKEYAFARTSENWVKVVVRLIEIGSRLL